MPLIFSGITTKGSFDMVYTLPPRIYDLWSWGRNSYGLLGLGNTTNYSSPKQVGSLTPWLRISAGYNHSLAIKTDGTMWSWGRNFGGALGLGDETNRSSPVQIGSSTYWSSISGGEFHNLALKTDGTMWSWGRNTYGQVGDNTTTNKSSPVQIGALTTWLKVSAGFYHAVAVKTDGTMWSWGYNGRGELGDGTTTNKSSPIQIGSLTNWSSVSASNYHSLAIKTDGTLWAWGYNSFGFTGILGVGDTITRSSPTQIGALTNWSTIPATMKGAFSLAIKTDGTLWTWGYNDRGQLGIGTAGNYQGRSSPVQVGALTTWSSIAAGHRHSTAIKTDGTLWSWGRNAYGQLGLGGTDYAVSSPVQVGSLTTWVNIAAGHSFTLATDN
jgi:alpha-tubulin suppressor-like RCC1 family protein